MSRSCACHGTHVTSATEHHVGCVQVWSGGRASERGWPDQQVAADTGPRDHGPRGEVTTRALPRLQADAVLNCIPILMTLPDQLPELCVSSGLTSCPLYVCCKYSEAPRKEQLDRAPVFWMSSRQGHSYSANQQCKGRRLSHSVPF